MTNSRRADGDDLSTYSPRPPALRRPVGTPRGRDQRDERGEARDAAVDFAAALSAEQAVDRASGEQRDPLDAAATVLALQPREASLRRLAPAAPALSPVHSVGRLEQSSSVGDPEDAASSRRSSFRASINGLELEGAPGLGLIAAMEGLPASAQPAVTRQSTAPALPVSRRSNMLGGELAPPVAVSGPPPARPVRRSMGPLASGPDTPSFPGSDVRDAS